MDRGLSEIPQIFCADAMGDLVIGSHVFGPVVIGDVDRGLSEIPQVFCAVALVHLVIGSLVFGSMCAGDLVWFLTGLQVFGSHPLFCWLRSGSWT